MKKIGCVLLAGIMVLSMAACGDLAPPAPGGLSDSGPQAPAGEGYELALIADIGGKAYHQACWEGVTKYAEEKGITPQSYSPAEQTAKAGLEAVDLAVQEGAKVVVGPSLQLGPAVALAQAKYPDVKFLLLDGRLDGVAQEGAAFEAGANTYCFRFAEEQAGFLAGYAAVKDGGKKLGFLGGAAVPAVVRYGYGYIQGAELAAKELDLLPGDVEIKYAYTGSFEPSPETRLLAASWYQGGTEVIFGCGVGSAVMDAAEAMAGKKVIGADLDQSTQSPAVVTSAVKNLSGAVYTAVSAVYSGKSTESVVVLDAKVEAVSLPMAASRFDAFSMEDYNAVHARLVSGELKLLGKNAAAAADKLPTNFVKVTMILI